MFRTPTVARAACWLVSTGLHVAIFIAAGHSPRAGEAGERDPLQLVAIDVAPEPVPLANDPSVAPSSERVSFVPPPTHTHPYPVPMDHDAHPHDPSLVHVPFAPAPLARQETPLTAPPAPARFTMLVTRTTLPGEGVTSGATRNGDSQSGSDAEPLPEESVSSPARLAASMSAVYPAEARAQGVEADVVVAIVVASTGDVVAARVLKTAGFGFDQEALRAVRAARFVPAQSEGRRVAVRMRWSVSVRLR